jgi:hypothetical protein
MHFQHGKTCFKHSLREHVYFQKHEFKKWKVILIFYVYFVQNGIATSNQEMWVKVGWEKVNTTF